MEATARGSQSSNARKLAIGIALALVGSTAIATVLALNPNLIGQWFVIRDDVVDGQSVYKVLARVTGFTVTGMKTATVNVEVKVFNNHTFAVSISNAHFTMVDLQQRRTTIIFDLGVPGGYPVTVSAKSGTDPGVLDKTVEAQGFKTTGLGNRYLVTGTVTWTELHSGGATAGPFTEAFSEVHSLTEFTGGP